MGSLVVVFSQTTMRNIRRSRKQTKEIVLIVSQFSLSWETHKKSEWIVNKHYLPFCLSRALHWEGKKLLRPHAESWLLGSCTMIFNKTLFWPFLKSEKVLKMRRMLKSLGATPLWILSHFMSGETVGLIIYANFHKSPPVLVVLIFWINN